MSDSSGISAEDWGKGITLSVVASLIGGASKLAIRKSWLMEEGDDGRVHDDGNYEQGSSPRPLTLDTHSDTSSDDDDDDAGTNPDNTIQAQMTTHCVALVLRYSGMVGMSLLNPICCVLAMKYASPSILAPFSGLTLVWVILFSGIVLGETPSVAQRTASALIIVGEVIVAAFGDHRNGVHLETRDVVSIYHCQRISGTPKRARSHKLFSRSCISLYHTRIHTLFLSLWP